MLSPEGRKRLLPATTAEVNKLTIVAAVALARDDYLNARHEDFNARIRQLLPKLEAKDITPELAIWIAVMKGEEQSGPRWQALIERVAQYDPKIKQLFN